MSRDKFENKLQKKSHAEEYLIGTGLRHSKSVPIAKQGFLKKPYFLDR